MRILLHGEGITDYGQDDMNGGWIEGPIQVLIKRMIDNAEISSVTKSDIKTKRGHLQRKLYGLSGHGTYAALLSHIAKEQGYEVAALYRDADRHSKEDARQEHVCRKRYCEVKDGIYEGFQRFDSGIQYIAIIPMKMIENWLLADPQSFAAAFEGDRPRLPNRPELIWGDEQDPSSNHPKNVLKRILNDYQNESNVDTYCALAENMDIATVRSKCPISFADFCQQIELLHAEN